MYMPSAQAVLVCAPGFSFGARMMMLVCSGFQSVHAVLLMRNPHVHASSSGQRARQHRVPVSKRLWAMGARYKPQLELAGCSRSLLTACSGPKAHAVLTALPRRSDNLLFPHQIRAQFIQSSFVALLTQLNARGACRSAAGHLGYGTVSCVKLSPSHFRLLLCKNHIAMIQGAFQINFQSCFTVCCFFACASRLQQRPLWTLQLEPAVTPSMWFCPACMHVIARPFCSPKTSTDLKQRYAAYKCVFASHRLCTTPPLHHGGTTEQKHIADAWIIPAPLAGTF